MKPPRSVKMKPSVGGGSDRALEPGVADLRDYAWTPRSCVTPFWTVYTYGESKGPTEGDALDHSRM